VTSTDKRRAFIRSVVLLLAPVIAALLLYLWSNLNLSPKRTYPVNANYPFVTIHDLKQRNPTSGFYDTEGYVAYIYSCPPCPSGAVCEACMKDNIVISEQDITMATYTLRDTELIIFVSQPEQFVLGRKYTYSIQISETRSTGDSINDVKLVGYSP
jgi:hypothetical protein